MGSDEDHSAGQTTQPVAHPDTKKGGQGRGRRQSSGVLCSSNTNSSTAAEQQRKEDVERSLLIERSGQERLRHGKQQRCRQHHGESPAVAKVFRGGRGHFRSHVRDHSVHCYPPPQIAAGFTLAPSRSSRSLGECSNSTCPANRMMIE